MNFDILAAFEFVDDGFVGDVEGGVGGDEFVVPFGAAEGDAADGGALLDELHGEVPLAGTHFFGRLAELDAGGAEDGAGVAGAEGGEGLDLAYGFERELAEGAFGIDADFGDAGGLGRFVGGVLAEGGAEGINFGFVDLEAGGTGVAAVADEMLGAGGEGGVQVHAVG